MSKDSSRALASQPAGPLPTSQGPGANDAQWDSHILRSHGDHRFNIDVSKILVPAQAGTVCPDPLNIGIGRIGIEVKASRHWRPEHGRALRDLRGEGVLTASHAVYVGDTPQQDGPVSVLPLYAFLEKLQAGQILPAAKQARPEARVRSVRR